MGLICVLAVRYGIYATRQDLKSMAEKTHQLNDHGIIIIIKCCVNIPLGLHWYVPELVITVSSWVILVLAHEYYVMKSYAVLELTQEVYWEVDKNLEKGDKNE